MHLRALLIEEEDVNGPMKEFQGFRVFRDHGLGVASRSRQGSHTNPLLKSHCSRDTATTQATPGFHEALHYMVVRAQRHPFAIRILSSRNVN